MKIISGGQTGVDQAALFAARDVDFSTGVMTQGGKRPEFKHMFGMNESTSEGYVSRTKTNILNSDGTLQIAEFWDSPGEKLTSKWIVEYKKPCRKIARAFLGSVETINYVYEWVLENDIYALNVAGNSEGTSPGIFDVAYAFLVNLFEKIDSTKREPKQLKLFL